MSERSIDPRLQKLWDDGVTVYSISRLDSIHNCLYGAYRSYVLHERGSGNVYSVLGGKTHDCLESIMNGEATEEDLLPAISDELENLEILGIEFPKDRNGGDSIKNGWIEDMTDFAKTYKAPKGNFKTEQLFLYQTDNGKWLQGYIDLTKYNSDGTISIYDYKTSSMYTKEGILEHGRQLILYALGMEQSGYKVKEVAWIMLKYVDVTFMGKKTARSKNKIEIKKTVERRKVAAELKDYVERDLIDAGFDEIDIELILTEFIKCNSFAVLPKEIADNYKIRPCVLKHDLSSELREECKEYLDKTIAMWESLDTENVLDFPPKSFYKISKTGKQQPDYFFCCNLCNHFKQCPHIHDFLDTLNKEDDDDDLF